MKAAWYSKNGEARDVLQLGEQPTPQPQTGEVLVRLRSSGVNPSDVKSRRGRPLTLGPIVIPHSDGAGVIEAVGEGVTSGRIGERVWTWNGQWQRPFGTAAQYIALPAAQAVTLPDAVDFNTAACFGIPALTAIHAVRLAEAAGAKTLLVTGAASAVGHYVTQIAAGKGMQVIGTASVARAAAALAAGATHVIDYKTEDVAARVAALTDGKGVDAIIDMDLSSTAPLLAKGVLAAHGTLVCYGSNAMGDVALPFRDLLFRGLNLRFFVVYELRPTDRQAAIDELALLLHKAALTTMIAARFPLEQIVAAHEAVEKGAFGNVVLEIG